MPARSLTSLVTRVAIPCALSACTSSSYAYGLGDPPASPPATAHSKTVEALPTIAFNPATVTVAVGDTVTFAFKNVAHNVFFDRTAGAPTDITDGTANANVARVFTAPGQFVYNCHIHPGMRGTVVVTAPAGP
jgi:plastocyanin